MIGGNFPVLIENMMVKGEIEPTVLVALQWQEDGGYVAPDDRLVKFVLPYIEANYNVSTEQSGRAITGFSAGGRVVNQQYLATDRKFGYYMLLESGIDASIRDSQAVADKLYADIPAGGLIPHLFMTMASINSGAVNNANAYNYLNKANLSSSMTFIDGNHDFVFCAEAFMQWVQKNYLWGPLISK
jgi:enterochelin esterase-like enzyme